MITTFKAKGQIADDHPLACGVLGRSGTPVASWFMNEADLLLVLGASFSNHTGIYPGKPIIQVDVDPLQLGKFHPVDGARLGRDRRRPRQPVPSDLATRRPTASTSAPKSPSAGRSGEPRRPAASATTAASGVNSAVVFAALGRHVPEDAVIAVDVGNHAYSFGRYFECKPGQSVLMSGYLGSIGFGYPAAIGAWAAAPERPIFAVTGDGGFAQYMAELLTAVKHEMNITHVLLNNGQLGKISQGAARRRLGGLADLAAQPGLLEVRRDLRRARDPGDRRLPTRRRARCRGRARRPGADRSTHRPRPDLKRGDDR